MTKCSGGCGANTYLGDICQCLPPRTVKAMKDAYRYGYSVADIARRIGVSRQRATAIVHRRDNDD